MNDSIRLKCSCGNPNCIEELTVTRFEDGKIKFFGFEEDLTLEQVAELITFLTEQTKVPDA